MGMDATTQVWVGYEAEKLYGRLPEEVTEQFENDGVIDVDGVTINRYYLCDDLVGYGIGLLGHDWDYGVMEVDLDSLVKKAAELKPKVAQIFKAWGIDDEPKVLLISNFS